MKTTMQIEKTLTVNSSHEFTGFAEITVDYWIEPACGDGWNEPKDPAQAHVNTIHASVDFSLDDGDGNTITFKKGADIEHLFDDSDIERIQDICLGDAEDDAEQAKIDAYILNKEFA